ncbi:thiol reductant ABC exporter subunit CydC [Tessaracoccus sp. OS52]|uniref:thiol reductant ABC exporter subunit CydC n=1 Tax=Tessaracoccus sp. OS52 TaxID=2886691 RepID=UPI001D10BE7C|nr:thiol reductant ABC exporter subunit CydC [Tessaracoccus sp. OS52]MCC2592485.1 thiol reductant ABC exporter subunit CydC [Tessaracoccus sp. OS52]
MARPLSTSRLWRLLRDLIDAVPGGRMRFLLATLLAALASASSVALLGTSAFLISFAALTPPVLFLQAPAVLVRAFGISRGVLRYLERVVGHDIALRMQSTLRLRIYDKLASTTLIGRRRGDLLTRIVADVAAIQDLVVRVVIPVLAAALVLLGTTVMLAFFDLGSAAVLLLTAILGGLIVPWIAQRASQRVDLAAVPTRGRLADNVREFSRTAPDLVAYGATDAALTQLLDIDDELRRQESHGAWVRGIATGAQVVAAGIAVVAALVLGGSAVVAGTMDPRLLGVLALTPLALHEVLGTFTQSAQTYTRAWAALQRVADTLDADPVGAGDVTLANRSEPGLLLDDVTVGWPGGSTVQTRLNLQVLPGERVALVGPSGVGKTTVAATVMGLIPPLAGTIHRGGRVGYLAQDAHIFATSIAENVRIGNKEASNDEVLTALARAGLDLSPDHVVGEGGHNLSGGERRRLAFARVIAAERDLLVLDEPTEHLDRATAIALVDDILATTRHDAVLVLTHDQELIARCNRQVRLRSPAPVARSAPSPVRPWQGNPVSRRQVT